jgi:hypothetical protein
MTRALRRAALGLWLLAACTGPAMGQGPSSPAAGHFAGKLELVPLFAKSHQPVISNGHQYYALRNAISFRRLDGTLLTAPAGMPTDLASTPKVVWWTMPPDGAWSEGATIHDDCYRTKGSFQWTWKARPGRPAKTFIGLSGRSPLTRADCDETFRQTMLALGVPGWKRVAIFEAVRTFGAMGWGT